MFTSHCFQRPKLHARQSHRTGITKKKDSWKEAQSFNEWQWLLMIQMRNPPSAYLCWMKRLNRFILRCVFGGCIFLPSDKNENSTQHSRLLLNIYCNCPNKCPAYRQMLRKYSQNKNTNTFIELVESTSHPSYRLPNSCMFKSLKLTACLCIISQVSTLALFHGR